MKDVQAFHFITLTYNKNAKNYKGQSGREGEGREGQKQRANDRMMLCAFNFKKVIREKAPVCLVGWRVVNGRPERTESEGLQSSSLQAKGCRQY